MKRRRMMRSPVVPALVLSVLFHGVTMAVLDVVEVSAAVPSPEPPMEFMELPEPAEPEPEPEPEIPEPEPEPAEAEAAPREVTPPRRTPRPARPAPAPVPQEETSLAATEDLALEMTDFRLSSADIGTSPGQRPQARRSPSTTGTTMSAAAPSTGPRFAPAASLARPPVPPNEARIARCLERSYPRQAQQQGLSGSARVRLNIRPDGSPSLVRIASVSVPGQGFGEACTACLNGESWSPPLARNGQPVSTRVMYTCRFAVRD
ncbi:MAG: TonB family protein [Polyangiales bacterium]